jgi:hypothetical protein
MSLITSLAGTIIIGGRVMSILSSVGTSLIIGTVTSTTSTIVRSIAHLTSYDQPSVQEVVNKLQLIDLEFTVSVIEELVREQEKDGEEMKLSVKKALLGVLDMLEKIDTELKIIELAVKDHDAKYLNSWRTFDCGCNIKTIENHTSLLRHRYGMLRDLLTIYSN